MRILILASLTATCVAMPAAAQQYTNFGSEMGFRSNSYKHVENFAKCVVRTDPHAAIAYVRSELDSPAERNAIDGLSAAYSACGSHLTKWGGTRAPERMRRDAILVALHRYRERIAARD